MSWFWPINCDSLCILLVVSPLSYHISNTSTFLSNQEGDGWVNIPIVKHRCQYFISVFYMNSMRSSLGNPYHIITWFRFLISSSTLFPSKSALILEREENDFTLYMVYYLMTTWAIWCAPPETKMLLPGRSLENKMQSLGEVY